MTALTTVGAAATDLQASPRPPASIGTALDANGFLKMLVAELQYQDPTKPMDSTQLVQQFSSMSEVEQATQSNVKLSSILDQLSIGQASGLIGRTVGSPDGSQSGTIEAIQITAGGAVAHLSDGTRLLLSQGVTVGA